MTACCSNARSAPVGPRLPDRCGPPSRRSSVPSTWGGRCPVLRRDRSGADRRTVAWSGDGRRCRVEESVDWKIAVPFWGWIFEPLVRPAFRGADHRGPSRGGRARTAHRPSSRRCWPHPRRVPRRRRGCIYALLAQLLTFIAEDLGNGTRSPAGASPRRVADRRRGDHRGHPRSPTASVDVAWRDLVVLRRARPGAVLTAAAPSLWVVAGLQLLCRNLSIAG